MAFVNEGRIVALDTPRHLEIAHGQRLAKVLLKGGEGLEATEVTFSLDRPADARRLSDYVAQGQVLTMHSEEASLEDVATKLAGRNLACGASLSTVGLDLLVLAVATIVVTAAVVRVLHRGRR